MKKSFLSHILLLTFLIVFVIFVLAPVAFGQPGASVSRTQCKVWDDAFLTIFNWALVIVFIAALVLSLLSGLLGRLIWSFTSPNIRILIVTFSCLLLMILGVGLGPWTIGLGRAWFSGIDPRYFDCTSTQFGAEGLFAGQLGAGVSAIAQTPAIIVALSAAAILGGILALLISSTALRVLGVPAKVKGEQV
jgi:hypothetical protein